MLNIEEIRELIQMIDESTIDEFTYETKESSVTLKRNVSQNVTQTVTQQPQQIPVNTAPTPVTRQVDKQVEQKDVDSSVDYDYEITSPMVGTFYRSSSPEKDAFVEKGSSVSDNTVVCIIEAMKLFNEIEAETNGQIVEILASDGELVEFGQPLFRVKK